jgi:hypothetical protein
MKLKLSNAELNRFETFLQYFAVPSELGQKALLGLHTVVSARTIETRMTRDKNYSVRCPGATISVWRGSELLGSVRFGINPDVVLTNRRSLPLTIFIQVNGGAQIRHAKQAIKATAIQILCLFAAGGVNPVRINGKVVGYK